MPTAPITGTVTQPVCGTPTGSVEISGLPSGNWTINQAGTAVANYTGTGATFTVSGLAPGNYTFTLTNSDVCTSPASTQVTINPSLTVPTAPITGTVTQPICGTPTGSVVLNGLPSGNWTINQAGTVVASYNGTGSSKTISGLAPGNYTFTLTNSDTCTSPASTSVTINPSLTVPTAPITVPDWLIVQLPEGNPFNTTEPVGVPQIGCVTVPVTGAVGTVKLGLIVTEAEAVETQPPVLVTVKV